MVGLAVNSGVVDGFEHVVQSIRDILTTPLGTRVLRRMYGSRVLDLIDAPSSKNVIIEVISATATAIDRWEPRYILKTVRVAEATAGKLVLEMSGFYVPDGINNPPDWRTVEGELREIKLELNK